jgi:hypothetical protein
MLWMFLLLSSGTSPERFLLGLALLRSHTVAAWSAIGVPGLARAAHRGLGGGQGVVRGRRAALDGRRDRSSRGSRAPARRRLGQSQSGEYMKPASARNGGARPARLVRPKPEGCRDGGADHLDSVEGRIGSNGLQAAPSDEASLAGKC